jgi:hypothetical protein
MNKRCRHVDMELEILLQQREPLHSDLCRLLSALQRYPTRCNFHRTSALHLAAFSIQLYYFLVLNPDCTNVHFEHDLTCLQGNILRGDWNEEA